MARPVTTIEVMIEGFPPVEFTHVSASAAFARAWEAYCRAYECTFKEFMSKSRRRVVPNRPGVGDPVRVLGRNAWIVEPHDHSPSFVYDGEKVIMRAHHTDVERGHAPLAK